MENTPSSGSTNAVKGRSKEITMVMTPNITAPIKSYRNVLQDPLVHLGQLEGTVDFAHHSLLRATAKTVLRIAVSNPPQLAK